LAGVDPTAPAKWGKLLQRLSKGKVFTPSFNKTGDRDFKDNSNRYLSHPNTLSNILKIQVYGGPLFQKKHEIIIAFLCTLRYPQIVLYVNKGSFAT